MLVCTPPEYRDSPTLRGFDVSGEEWRCDPEVYREFIRRVTGHSMNGHPTIGECHRIRTRLEGFVEQRKAHGEWTADLPTRYPDVRSLEEIETLARFFREYHEDRRRPNAVQ